MSLKHAEQSKHTKPAETLLRTCIYVQRGQGLVTATKQIIRDRYDKDSLPTSMRNNSKYFDIPLGKHWLVVTTYNTH